MIEDFPSLDVHEMAIGDSNAEMLNEILDNPGADAIISARAVDRAIARGMTREMAERLYGAPIGPGAPTRAVGPRSLSGYDHASPLSTS